MGSVARAKAAAPTRAALPGGLWRDAAPPLRVLALRPLADDDAIAALDALDAGLPPVTRANALLQRCLTDAPPGTARRLSVGDREALLLQLRRLSLGDELACVLACPARECGRPMELALQASGLLTPAYADAAPQYGLEILHEGRRWRLQFRLPCAEDLELAATLVQANAENAGLALLRRCLRQADCDGTPVDAAALPQAVRDAAATEMAARDPQAEIELALNCPVCGHTFTALFDTGNHLLQELEARARQTLHEVHTLAAHYGWHEREILRMPSRRRARYLGFIAEGRSGATASAAPSSGHALRAATR